jgi:hypothetical protein
MAKTELVAVRTFLTRIEAELARSALEAAEIDAMVDADDAGGTQSGLWLARGVRLLIRAEDIDRAEEILGIGSD